MITDNVVIVTSRSLTMLEAHVMCAFLEFDAFLACHARVCLEVSMQHMLPLMEDTG